MTKNSFMKKIGEKAKSASRDLSKMDIKKKNSVLNDVLNGYVSQKAAQKFYGVEVDMKNFLANRINK